MDVLLVERSSILRMRMARLLADLPGVRVVAVAETTREAREMVQVLQPDAVVLDMDQQGEGGLDLLRRMKAQASPPYIAVLTDEPSATFHARCMTVADLCLDKTHEMEALVEALGHRTAVVRDPRAADMPGCQEGQAPNCGCEGFIDRSCGISARGGDDEPDRPGSTRRA